MIYCYDVLLLLVHTTIFSNPWDDIDRIFTDHHFHEFSVKYPTKIGRNFTAKFGLFKNFGIAKFAKNPAFAAKYGRLKYGWLKYGWLKYGWLVYGWLKYG